MRIMRTITMTSNTILILISAWAYIEQDLSGILSISLIVCAIINTCLITKSKTNDFITWLSYSVSLLLIFIGVWANSKGLGWSHTLPKIGIVLIIIGLINTFYRIKAS